MASKFKDWNPDVTTDADINSEEKFNTGTCQTGAGHVTHISSINF